MCNRCKSEGGLIANVKLHFLFYQDVSEEENGSEEKESEESGEVIINMYKYHLISCASAQASNANVCLCVCDWTKTLTLEENHNSGTI